MELAWLEDFLALAECGHFSRAAEKRHITQPAFSRRVRTLEDWVGAQLFDRDTHRVELTAAGRVFKPMAQEATRRIYLGREQTRAAATGSAETVRFASTHVLSMVFFPQFLSRIEEHYHLGSTVSLVTNNMTGCEAVMQHGEAHFLLCHRHKSAATSLRPDQFLSLVVGHDVLMPLSVPDSETGEPRFALPGLVTEAVPYLSYSSTSGMGRILAATQALDMPPTWLASVFASHVATVLAAMTRSGRGMAWLPRSLVAGDLEAGALVRAGPEMFDVPIEICIVRPRARQSPAAEKFWATVKRRGSALDGQA
jgi:DNA-binding transcriptional LysR family regulator